jgi:hypothetical protein
MRRHQLLAALLALAALAGPAAAADAPPQASMAAVAAEADQLRQAADAKALDGYARWMKAADLTAIPEPKLSADPKASETKRAEEIAKANQLLEQLRGMRDGHPNLGSYNAVFSQKRNGEIWDRIAELRHPAR